MNQTNCPNCFAPIDPYQCKCKYCGTWYFDLMAFAESCLDDQKPCYVKMKTKAFGKDSIITFKAIPTLNEIEMQTGTTDAVDCHGNMLKHFITSRSCDVGITFHCLSDTPTSNFLTINTFEE